MDDRIVAEMEAQFRRLLAEPDGRQDTGHAPRSEPHAPLPVIFELFPLAKKVSVPKQIRFKGPGALPNELAKISCQRLGRQRLLNALNDIHGTRYTLDPKESHLSWQLAICISKGWDLGTAYSHMRPRWQAKDFGGPLIEDLDFGDIDVYNIAARAARAIGRRDQSVFTDPFGVLCYIPPRRVWDLYSNRVIDYGVVELWEDTSGLVWRISHSWVDASELRTVMTPINNFQWPVPIPADVDLEQVRIELLNAGAQYAWLDVLCLRQSGLEEHEELRKKEWRVDVPSIGFVYSPPHRSRRPVEYGPVACYFNGLGRPFVLEEGTLSSQRHWLNRAWTLQEHKHDMITLGLTPASPTRAHARHSAVVRQFYERLDMLPSHPPPNIFAVLRSMQPRAAAKPTDKVFGLAYFLVTPRYPHGVPAYLENEDPEAAWLRLLGAMEQRYRLDLVFLFPRAGDGKVAWAPSWKQVMYCDLSALAAAPATDYRHTHFLHERVSNFMERLPDFVADFIPDLIKDPEEGLLSQPVLQLVSERHVKKILDATGQLFTRGYAVTSCIVRGLGGLPAVGAPRRGYVQIAGNTVEVRVAHRELIPDGEYALVGRDGVTSEVWVVAKLVQQDRRRFSGSTLWIRKVSVLLMTTDSRLKLGSLDPGELMSLRFT
ncbi:hypothetical protein PsYK624_108640 [Phanerochaete sordida]|uniref:Heterokaryon incompatibility domain-containing protein n=1 Tax=Phanerochaete sordida TaxID=48140 RepID=A0A9P3LH87_9APHY|nr:hypothetical protein PsYK624_108640 [Phanerochaete sordida]